MDVVDYSTTDQTPLLSALDYSVVIELDVSDPVLCYNLDQHTFEVNRHSPLQLVRAHGQDLHALHERNIGMVMFVEDGKAVVPRRRASVSYILTHRLASTITMERRHTERSRERRTVLVPAPRGSRASRGLA
jgi:hypothetical protein